MTKSLYVIFIGMLLFTPSRGREIRVFAGSGQADRAVAREIRKSLPSSLSASTIYRTLTCRDLADSLNLIILIGDQADAYRTCIEKNPDRKCPSVIFTDPERYEKYRSSLPLATVYTAPLSTEYVYNKLKNQYPETRELSLMYNARNQRETSKTIRRLRQRGISVRAIPLRGEMTESYVTEQIKKIGSDDRQALLISSSEAEQAIAASSALKKTLKKHVTACISTGSAAARSISAQVPVYYTGPSPAATGKLLAARALLILETPALAGRNDMEVNISFIRLYDRGQSRYIAPPTAGTINTLLRRARREYTPDRATPVAPTAETTEQTPRDTASPNRGAEKAQSPNPSKATPAPSQGRTAQPKNSGDEEESLRKQSQPTGRKASHKKKSQQQLRNTSLSAADSTLPKGVPAVVTTDVANIFSQIKPKPILLGAVRQDDTLLVLDSSGNFLRIAVWGKTGYIKKTAVLPAHRNIKMEPEMPAPDRQKLLILAGAVTAGLLLLIILLLVYLHKRKYQKGKYRSALIISGHARKIRLLRRGKALPLKKYLRKRNILVTVVKSSSQLRSRMLQHMPDIIIADCKMNRNLPDMLREQLSSYRLSAATSLLLYNTAFADKDCTMLPYGDAALFTAEKHPKEGDIEQIISNRSGAVSHRQQAKTNSHLSGILEGENLADVLQLIEGSRKNGCLVLEDDKPYGALFFAEGKIVYAATRTGIFGEEGLYDILNMDQGSFHFLLNRKPPRRDLSLSPIAVLMNHRTHIDHHLAEAEGDIL
ncbi:MAG: DUF4388 domain-containing protein [Fibrobacterota bacterium]